MKKKVLSIIMILTMAFSIQMPVSAAEVQTVEEAGEETSDATYDAEDALVQEAVERDTSEETLVGAEEEKQEIDLTPGKGTVDLSSITFSKQVADAGDNITIKVKTENTKRIHFYYDYRTSDKVTKTFQTTSSVVGNERGQCRYDKNIGEFTITMKIPENAVGGVWKLHDIQMVDDEDHYSYVLASKTDLSMFDITIASVNTGRTVPHYTWQTDGGNWDGTHYYFKDGTMATDIFFCDGTYTYYLQKDGTPMKSRLTYHPNGVNVIYFDQDGHEAFNQFVNVRTSIEGKPVDDICYFDTFGYMYQDKLTYGQGNDTNLYYINPYGVMQRGGYFRFPNGDLGYAADNGALMTNQDSYSPSGEPVYFDAMGHARPR